MKLSEMREALASEGIQLTKSLGQNFLHDSNQLRRIAGLAELSPQDRVLEIGPGLGPLTELLMEAAGEVLGIEKDRKLHVWLCRRFAAALAGPAQSAGALQANVEPPERPSPRLRLLHDDAVEYLKREPRDWSRWKLVANLPYSVSSPILVELSCGTRAPERMVVTLQSEVAKRLMARPGEKDFGVLTLLVQADFEPRGWFKIPSSCFFPEPEVDSACVCLVRRPEALLPAGQRDSFRRLVKLGFSQRRKMMMKLLKQNWPAEKLAGAFERLGLPAGIRAEAVSLEQFAGLTELLCGSGPPN